MYNLLLFIGHLAVNLLTNGFDHVNGSQTRRNHTVIMSPPEGLGDILFFPGRPDVWMSVCLSRIVSAL